MMETCTRHSFRCFCGREAEKMAEEKQKDRLIVELKRQIQEARRDIQEIPKMKAKVESLEDRVSSFGVSEVLEPFSHFASSL